MWSTVEKNRDYRLIATKLIIIDSSYACFEQFTLTKQLTAAVKRHTVSEFLQSQIATQKYTVSLTLSLAFNFVQLMSSLL